MTSFMNDALSIKVSNFLNRIYLQALVADRNLRPIGEMAVLRSLSGGILHRRFLHADSTVCRGDIARQNPRIAGLVLHSVDELGDAFDVHRGTSLRLLHHAEGHDFAADHVLRAVLVLPGIAIVLAPPWER